MCRGLSDLFTRLFPAPASGVGPQHCEKRKTWRKSNMKKMIERLERGAALRKGWRSWMGLVLRIGKTWQRWREQSEVPLLVHFNHSYNIHKDTYKCSPLSSDRPFVLDVAVLGGWAEGAQSLLEDFAPYAFPPDLPWDLMVREVGWCSWTCRMWECGTPAGMFAWWIPDGEPEHLLNLSSYHGGSVGLRAGKTWSQEVEYVDLWESSGMRHLKIMKIAAAIIHSG